MTRLPVFLVAILLAVPVLAADSSKTYVGIVTDTMCATDHTIMKVVPDTKCVKECVGDGKTYKYALADGKGVYVLSDQQTPAKFAGRRVKVTGILYTRTNVLKVNAIAAAD